MIGKIIMLAVSALSLRGSAASSAASIEVVKKTIRVEVLAMAFKILAGVVLVSIIIYSIFEVGDAVTSVIAQFENSDTIRLLVFGFVACVGSLLLFILFRVSSRFPLAKTAPQPTGAIHFQAVALRFAEGLLAGLSARAEVAEPREPTL